MSDYHDTYFPGEAERILMRLAHACNQNPVTAEELVQAAEFLAACTRYGLNVVDVLQYGINRYPHIKAMMAEESGSCGSNTAP